MRFGKVSQQDFQSLLARSRDRLSPLDDPLQTDFGAHRWLSEEREETYSDWLRWIVDQLKSVRHVFRILGISAPDVASRCLDLHLSTNREEVITGGRLDLVIRCGHEAIVVVEVKTASAEQSDTHKQKRYSRWLKVQADYRFRHAILVCVDAEEEDYEGFTSVRWGDICINLRRLIPAILRERGVVAAAMTLAFVGAVEINLLHLPVAGTRAGALSSLQVLRAVAHLERFLESEG